MSSTNSALNSILGRWGQQSPDEGQVREAISTAMSDRRLSADEREALVAALDGGFATPAARKRLSAFLQISDVTIQQLATELEFDDGVISRTDAAQLLALLDGEGTADQRFSLSAVLVGSRLSSTARELLANQAAPADALERLARIELRDDSAAAAIRALLAGPRPISGAAFQKAMLEGTGDQDGEGSGEEFDDFKSLVDVCRDQMSKAALRKFAVYERMAKANRANGKSGMDTGALELAVTAVDALPEYRDSGAGIAIDRLIAGTLPISDRVLEQAIIDGTGDSDGHGAGAEFEDFHDFVVMHWDDLTPHAREKFEVYVNMATKARAAGKSGISTEKLEAKMKALGYALADGSVDLPDPVARDKDLTKMGGKIAHERFTGHLFVDGVSADDVKQGRIADCYLCGAAAAVAAEHPEVILKLITDNEDGTFTVNFKDDRGGEFPVRVDGDLYVRGSGAPYYGADMVNRTDKSSMELWFAILEKAYAKWKGSYETMGNGGFATQVMTAITGASSKAHNHTSADRVWTRVRQAMDNDYPCTMATFGKDDGVDYTGSGLSAWHVYTVLGYSVENGQRFVHLRNPWGNTEPGHDGKDDGFFKLELEKVMKYYSWTHVNHYG